MEADLVPPDDPRLERAWRALQDDGLVPSPFLSWEWFSALRDTPPLARATGVLLVSDADGPCALLPVESRRGPGLARTLGFASWWWATPDHLDLVARPEHRDAAAAAVVGHLRARRDWEILDLDGLVPSSPLLPALRRLHRPLFWPRRDEEVSCAYVDLEAGSGDRSIRSRNARSQVRRDFRRASEAGGGLEVLSTPDAVAAAFEQLVSLHVRHWGANSTVFATPERRTFQRLAATRLAEGGHTRIYRLHAGGATEALLYALLWGDTLAYYVSGRLEGGKLQSPGQTLIGKIIESAADEGLRRFDLLRGEHSYKARFATGEEADVRLKVARAGWRSGLTATDRLLDRCAETVAARLP